MLPLKLFVCFYPHIGIDTNRNREHVPNLTKQPYQVGMDVYSNISKAPRTHDAGV